MRRIMILVIMLLALMLPSMVHAEVLSLQYDGVVQMYKDAQYTLIVKNETLDDLPLPPIIFNDRALVPIREVFEALGATVDYDSATKGIMVKLNDTTVKLTINSNDAYVNDKKVSIPDGVVPKLIGKVGEDAKTMVPVRFISESVGLKIDFDEKNGAILVESSSISTQTPATQTPSTQVPTTQPVETPITSQSNKINKIEYTENDMGIVVTIEGSRNITDYSDFEMTEPYRIVVDLNNTDVSSVLSQVNINKKYVEQVRVGQHEQSSRIVVDMKESRSYYITTDGNYMWINIVTDNEPVVQTPSDNENGENNSEKIVVLDAGHGGNDGGTHGFTSNGTRYEEKDITLLITQYTRDILVQNGVNVIMTRDGDTYPELTERADIANSNNASIFVSIHLNSVDNVPTASGMEVYYAKANNGSNYGLTSEQLANIVHDCLDASIGIKDRGVKTANHVVTRSSVMPAILVEVGFMSNVEEMDKLANPDFQYKAAQGIAQGIMNSLGRVNSSDRSKILGISTPTLSIGENVNLNVNEIEYMTD